MPQTPTEIAFWILGLFITGAASMVVRVLYRISNSIESLNQQVAVVIEKVTYHEKILDRHEEQINKLEHRRR